MRQDGLWKPSGHPGSAWRGIANLIGYLMQSPRPKTNKQRLFWFLVWDGVSNIQSVGWHFSDGGQEEMVSYSGKHYSLAPTYHVGAEFGVAKRLRFSGWTGSCSDSKCEHSSHQWQTWVMPPEGYQCHQPVLQWKHGKWIFNSFHHSTPQSQTVSNCTVGSICHLSLKGNGGNGASALSGIARDRQRFSQSKPFSTTPWHPLPMESTLKVLIPEWTLVWKRSHFTA